MYKIRLKILLGLFGVFLAVMWGRLGYMQLSQGDYYRTQAEESLQSIKLLPGQRGRILDRNGAILAEDRACHNFCLDYRLLTSEPRWIRRQVRAIAKEKQINWRTEDGYKQAETIFNERRDYAYTIGRRLAEKLGQDFDESVRRVVASVKRVRRAVGRTVREERLSHSIITGLPERYTIELRKAIPSETVGTSLVPSHQRVYPFKDTACHIIGVTGPVFREEMERYNQTADQAAWLPRMRRNYLPGDVIGKMGVEKMAEKWLRPVRGYQRLEKIDQIAEQHPPADGKDVHLTIDIELQKRLTEVMANTGHTGSIAVLDVDTSDVLALVSWPTYDLNTYRKNYTKLARDVFNLPLMNRAVSACYAPGSTVKPITGLAGLGEGKITTATTLECGRKQNPYARNGRPRCWLYKQYGRTHGPEDIVSALKHSCNVYFVRVGHLLGAQALTDWFGYFGFGQKPGTGLPEERSGGLGTQTYMRRVYKRGYWPSDAWNMAIGQGVFSASVLHVAAAHATIARGGTYYSPRIALEATPSRRKLQLPLAASYMQAVQQGMYEVVNDHGGTAHKVFHRRGTPPTVDICGKTGTAQVPPMRIDSNGDGRVNREDSIVKEGNHAWFAGFAPYRKPKIAFAILAEYAGSGGSNAGPIAKEVVRICGEMGYLGEMPRPATPEGGLYDE